MIMGGGIEWIDLAQEKESGRLLWKWWWTLEFHIMGGISWLNKEQLASQEGVSSLVSYFVDYGL
jgi:hypothetical protein